MRGTETKADRHLAGYSHKQDRGIYTQTHETHNHTCEMTPSSVIFRTSPVQKSKTKPDHINRSMTNSVSTSHNNKMANGTSQQNIWEQTFLDKAYIDIDREQLSTISPFLHKELEGWPADELRIDTHGKQHAVRSGAHCMHGVRQHR
jgi:hypothetical protein